MYFVRDGWDILPRIGLSGDIEVVLLEVGEQSKELDEAAEKILGHGRLVTRIPITAVGKTEPGA